MSSLVSYHIGTVCNRQIPAERERLSGILNYVSHHPELHLEIFTHNQRPRILKAELDGIIGRFLAKSQFKLFQRMPVVQLENPVFRSDAAISIDNEAIADCAFSHFRKRGFTDYAYVCSDNPKESAHSCEREKAFRSAAENAGFTCQIYRFRRQTSPRPQMSKLHPLSKWLSGLPKPCAVMTYSDDIALLTIDACHYAHLAVPEQIQIIGVDNDLAICENAQPEITSIWPDFYEAGRRAAEILHKIILNGRPAKAITLKYGVRAIVERTSTVDLRGGGRLVSLANSYLRQNFRSRLSISDLAKSLNVSRRLLEIRYREIMGRTVHEEWSRLRLEEAKRLLSARLPVESVFERCGFSTVAAFRKAFKSHCEVNPSEWGK